MPVLSKKLCKWSSAAFSQIFAVKGQFELGLKQDYSTFGFFSNGFTNACLKKAGTDPEKRLLFPTAKIHINNTINDLFKKEEVGTDRFYIIHKEIQKIFTQCGRLRRIGIAYRIYDRIENIKLRPGSVWVP